MNGPAEAETGGVQLPGYRLQRLLAASSRYEVFQAWSEDRSAAVAIKLAGPARGVDSGEKLLDEGRILAGLSHPNLLRLYEAHPEPVPALVLELLTGPSIADLFDRQDVFALRRCGRDGPSGGRRHRLPAPIRLAARRPSSRAT